MLILYLIFHICCGIIAAGILCAYYKNAFLSSYYIYRKDVGFSIFLGILCGPAGLIVSYFLTGFAKYGMDFKRKEKEPA